IEQKYGIPGRAYADFATLRGDPSDGLPGVKGVGEKLAASLVARYGGIDGIIHAIEDGQESVALNRVKRDLDYVRRARKVVAIPTDLPIPDVDISRPRVVPDQELFEFADSYALGGATRRLAAVLTGTTIEQRRT
ncbi:MAG: flap endonuclease, partial [Actinomycetota bacterium]|nr:flap endonuclease [Actinomycetota bacterium]